MARWLWVLAGCVLVVATVLDTARNVREHAVLDGWGIATVTCLELCPSLLSVTCFVRAARLPKQ